MAESRTPLLLALGLLSILFALTLWVTSFPADTLRARDEARRQVTTALAEEDQPERASELFRRARAASAVYAFCEEGARLRASGLFADAAQRFELCLRGDPSLAAAHRAWAESLLRARGRPAYAKVRTHLRRFVDTTRQDPHADREEVRAIEDLILDVEDFLEEDAPGEHTEPWTAGEIVAILSREYIRGTSRYDGPRVPLRLGFRPGEAELGATARAQLRDVAKALRDGVLATVVIQIEGHTDDEEAKSRSARQALGRRRAEVVREYLVREHGISRTRLKVAGFADQYPLQTNSTADSRAANRRVELVNMETKEPLPEDARSRR